MFLLFYRIGWYIMSNIYKSLECLIGNTPLVELSNFESKHKLDCEIDVKVEFFNPLGSSKDRIALRMIEDGIANGSINKELKNINNYKIKKINIFKRIINKINNILKYI